MIFRQMFIPLYIQTVSRGHILSSYDIPPGIRRLSRSWCILWEASSCSSRKELQKRYAFPDCRHVPHDRPYSCVLFHDSHEENEDFVFHCENSSEFQSSHWWQLPCYGIENTGHNLKYYRENKIHQEICLANVLQSWLHENRDRRRSHRRQPDHAGTGFR